jgi:hypothetical protein
VLALTGTTQPTSVTLVETVRGRQVVGSRNHPEEGSNATHLARAQIVPQALTLTTIAILPACGKKPAPEPARRPKAGAAEGTLTEQHRPRP